MAAERRDPEAWRRLRTSMESLSARDFPSVVELAPELARTTGGDEQFDYGLDLLLAGLQAQNTIVTMARMPMQTISARSAIGGSFRP